MTTGVVQPLFQLPMPISWSELIVAGRANLVPQPLATHEIRRAISTAYYAAFHALTASSRRVDHLHSGRFQV